MKATSIMFVAWVTVLACGCSQSESVSAGPAGGHTECAKPNGTFEPPTNLGSVVNSPYHEGSPCISRDGLNLYFDSIRPNGAGDWDIWVTRRQSVDSEWGDPEMLPPPVNSRFGESGPCISADGLVLYFASNRPSGFGNFDLWMTTREATDQPWQEPVNVGKVVNSWAYDNHPSISPDGLSLYFDSARPNASGNSMNHDLYVTRRATTADEWSIPSNLGSAVNTDKIQYSPDVLPNGLTMFFDSRITNRDLWMTTRQGAGDDWAHAVSLEPPMNTGWIDTDPSMWVDGCILFFVSARPGGEGGFDIWQAAVRKASDEIQ